MPPSKVRSLKLSKAKELFTEIATQEIPCVIGENGVIYAILIPVTRVHPTNISDKRQALLNASKLFEAVTYQLCQWDI